jgi:hypothetical protein
MIPTQAMQQNSGDRFRRRLHVSHAHPNCVISNHHAD